MKKKSNLNFYKIGENITALMEAHQIDASELSQHTGLPCSTISRLRSNTTEFSPNLSSLIPIAEFFRISLSQLIGEAPIDKTIQTAVKSLKNFPIPVLNADQVIEYIFHNKLLSTLFITVDLPLREKTFAYVMQGNAMEPQFPDKTLLIIDPTLEPENLDHVLVIPFGKKIPLFRQILMDGEDKYLRTLNATFNEFIKITNENYTILGVMIQSRRHFKDSSSHAIYNENHHKKINSI